MPDPKRVVSQGLSLLARLGMSPQESLDIICAAAEAAGNRMKEGGSPRVGWLRLIWQEADRRRRPYLQASKAREGQQDGK